MLMKRKEYESPTIQVVEVKQTGMLMTSGVGATRGEDYGNAIEETWE